MLVLQQATLSNTTAFLMGSVLGLFGVPSGYRQYVAGLLFLPLLTAIVINSTREARNALLSVGKYWLPWVVFLGISGWSSAEGVWKFQTYFLTLLLPCLIFGLMAASEPRIFQKYFFRTLLALNIFALVVLWSGAFNFLSGAIPNFSPVERNIVLSRLTGINLVYMLITSRWKTHPVSTIPLMLVLACVMLLIGSRGPVISVMMTAGIYSLVINRKNLFRFVLIGMTVTMLIATITFSDTLKGYVMSFSTHGKELKMNKYFGQDRFAAYEPTLQIFVEHPLIGLGLGQWWPEYRKRFVDKYSSLHTEARLNKIKTGLDYAYPHNIILEILTELGLVGMAFFAMLFLPFKRLFDLSNEYNLLCLLGFFYACSSGDITLNAALMIFNLLSFLRAKGGLPVATDDKFQRADTIPNGGSCKVSENADFCVKDG